MLDNIYSKTIALTFEVRYLEQYGDDDDDGGGDGDIEGDDGDGGDSSQLGFIGCGLFPLVIVNTTSLTVGLGDFDACCIFDH